MAAFDQLETGVKHCFVADVATVEVRGLAEDGAPLAGWWVIVEAADGTRKEAQLDDAGTAHLTGFTPGPVRVRFVEDPPDQVGPASAEAGGSPPASDTHVPDAGESPAARLRRQSLAALLPHLA